MENRQKFVEIIYKNLKMRWTKIFSNFQCQKSKIMEIGNDKIN